jgi:DNA-binding MarR family transcriptional regulator
MNALSQAPARRAQLTALATTIGWERSRLSHHLQRMGGRGLIERVKSETDRRAWNVVLTDTGWHALSSAAPRHAAWIRTLFFDDIDAGQEAELADILAVVYENILRKGTLPRPS